MTEILLLADTHGPRRARARPAPGGAAAAAGAGGRPAGAGGAGARRAARALRAARLVGCYGNNDGAQLRQRLPEVARVELDGLRFAVVHETGAAAGRERRCEAAYPDVDVLVFGHSHIPWDTSTPRGLRLLNPGSPTDRRRQPHCTYLTARTDRGRLTDVVLHRLPPRTRL